MATDPYSSPSVFFGSELKHRRERAGMTQQELADAMKYSLDTIKSVETGRLFASEEFTATADMVLQLDGDLVRLREFINRISMRPWFRDRIIIERKASEVWEYEPYVVSGLLQTEGYMRAVARGVRPVLSHDEIEEAVALRMERQELLNRSNAPHLWVIMDESALHRVVGNSAVMREQRDHLVKMSERPNVAIQIIPFSQGVTSGFGRSFSVLTLPTNSRLVYLEDIKDARYIREPEKVRQYVLVFDYLRASALDDDKSAALIKG